MGPCPSTERKTPPQTKHKLSSTGPFFFSRHHSGTGTPAPFHLIHECAHAGAEKRLGKNFFTKKKQQPHSWAAVAMGPRGSQQMAGEPSLRPALKLSTQACHSHSPHSGGTRPRRRAAGPRDTAPPSPLPRCLRRHVRSSGTTNPVGMRDFGTLRVSLTGRMWFADQRLGHCLFLRPCSVLIGSEKIEPKGLIQTLMQGWASSCSLGGGGSSLQDKGLRWGGLDRGRDILFTAKTSLHPNHSRGAQFRAKATARKDSLSNRCYKQLRNVRESEQRETNVKMH